MAHIFKYIYLTECGRSKNNTYALPRGYSLTVCAIVGIPCRRPRDSVRLTSSENGLLYIIYIYIYIYKYKYIFCFGNLLCNSFTSVFPETKQQGRMCTSHPTRHSLRSSKTIHLLIGDTCKRANSVKSKIEKLRKKKTTR